MKESELQSAVANYIRARYPRVIFHSDFGSGAKLTPAQAIRQYKQNGGLKGYPDMFIAEPNTIGDEIFHGLFIELKREGVKLKKKNGDWANSHIAEQAQMLERLRGRGYAAMFCIGLDQAIEAIDSYLGVSTEDER